MSGLKKQYGWTVSIFLPITPFFAKLCTNLKITANQVSWASLFVFLFGLYFYIEYNDNIYYRILAIVLFALGTFLDVLDGAVARYSNTSSKYGSFLDTIIDLIRYDLFFMAVFYLYSFSLLDTVVLLIYVLLLNYSFLSFIYKLFNNVDYSNTNTSLYEKYLPESYKNFCLRYRLLYNPLNLEDQLLFLFFVLGVLFQVEVIMLYIALFARFIDVYLILKNRKN